MSQTQESEVPTPPADDALEDTNLLSEASDLQASDMNSIVYQEHLFMGHPYGSWNPNKHSAYTYYAPEYQRQPYQEALQHQPHQFNQFGMPQMALQLMYNSQMVDGMLGFQPPPGIHHMPSGPFQAYSQHPSLIQKNSEIQPIQGFSQILIQPPPGFPVQEPPGVIIPLPSLYHPGLLPSPPGYYHPESLQPLTQPLYLEPIQPAENLVYHLNAVCPLLSGGLQRTPPYLGNQRTIYGEPGFRFKPRKYGKPKFENRDQKNADSLNGNAIDTVSTAQDQETSVTIPKMRLNRGKVNRMRRSILNNIDIIVEEPEELESEEDSIRAEGLYLYSGVSFEAVSTKDNYSRGPIDTQEETIKLETLASPGCKLANAPTFDYQPAGEFENSSSFSGDGQGSGEEKTDDKTLVSMLCSAQNQEKPNQSVNIVDNSLSIKELEEYSIAQAYNDKENNEPFPIKLLSNMFKINLESDLELTVYKVSFLDRRNCPITARSFWTAVSSQKRRFCNMKELIFDGNETLYCKESLAFGDKVKGGLLEHLYFNMDGKKITMWLTERRIVSIKRDPQTETDIKVFEKFIHALLLNRHRRNGWKNKQTFVTENDNVIWRYNDFVQHLQGGAQCTRGVNFTVCAGLNVGHLVKVAFKHEIVNMPGKSVSSLFFELLNKHFGSEGKRKDIKKLIHSERIKDLMNDILKDRHLQVIFRKEKFFGRYIRIAGISAENHMNDVSSFCKIKL